MDSSVLREFLVKLGYKVDPASERRMREGVERMSDMVMQMAKAAAVMATAVGVAVVKVADDLSDLHFASKRIGASAGNIRAFEFAIKQLGGSGEAARATLEAVARFMRNSPGAEDWITGQFGVQTRDANGNLRDTVEITKEIASVLKELESSKANVLAERIGMDDNTLQAIRSGDLQAFMADYLATLDKLGIKQDEAAASAAKFSRSLQEIKTIVQLLVEKYSIKLVEWFNENAEAISKFATVAALALGPFWALGKALSFLGGALKMVIAPLQALSGGGLLGALGRMLGVGGMLATYSGGLNEGEDAAMKRIHAMQDAGNPYKTGKPDSGPSGSAAALFGNLEKQYGLPAGLLDRMWNQESGRGKNMLSPKGAMGHFQFMPGTAKQYGVSDPNDLTQSATGAAKYLRDLMGMFGGDINRAVAAYNWGPGNVQRYGLGAAPSETRQYLKNVAPMSLQSSTTINVSGVSDPMSAAQAVANIQIQTFQDMTRNFQGAMQ